MRRENDCGLPIWAAKLVMGFVTLQCITLYTFGPQIPDTSLFASNIQTASDSEIGEKRTQLTQTVFPLESLRGASTISERRPGSPKTRSIFGVDWQSHASLEPDISWQSGTHHHAVIARSEYRDEAILVDMVAVWKTRPGSSLDAS